MDSVTAFDVAFREKTRDLFTIEEAAKWLGMSRAALYNHYRRGHIRPEVLQCHRLYFSRDAIQDFITNYRPVL